MTPRISVVMPFHNRPREAEACLRRLLRQTLSQSSYEIIAVDNNSTDDVSRIHALTGVRTISCSTKGAAAARNAGIAAARGSIIAFTDSDCLPAPDWLEQITRPLEEDDVVVACGGRILGVEQENEVAFFSQVKGLLSQEKFIRGGPTAPPFFATANAAWRRDALQRVGGFREGVEVCEDADLTWRALEAGGTIVYEPRARVAHRHRRTFRGLYRQAFSYGMGSVRAIWLHRDKPIVRDRVDWTAWMHLGMQPFYAVRLLLMEKEPVFRRFWIYESVWYTGFLLGRVAGSVRYRIVCF